MQAVCSPIRNRWTARAPRATGGAVSQRRRGRPAAARSAGVRPAAVRWEFAGETTFEQPDRHPAPERPRRPPDDRKNPPEDWATTQLNERSRGPSPDRRTRMSSRQPGTPQIITHQPRRSAPPLFTTSRPPASRRRRSDPRWSAGFGCVDFGARVASRCVGPRLACSRSGLIRTSPSQVSALQTGDEPRAGVELTAARPCLVRSGTGGGCCAGLPKATGEARSQELLRLIAVSNGRRPK